MFHVFLYTFEEGYVEHINLVAMQTDISGVIPTKVTNETERESVVAAMSDLLRATITKKNPTNLMQLVKTYLIKTLR